MRLQQPKNTLWCQDRQGRQTLFGDLAAQVAGRETPLRALNVSQVALYFNCSKLFSVALLSCLKARVEVVILPNLLPATLAELSDQFECLITDQTLLCHVRTEQWLWQPGLIAREFDFSVAPETVLHLFTSGSTGQAKKVSKRLQWLHAELQDLQALFAPAMQQGLLVSSVSHQHLYGLLFKVLYSLLFAQPFVVEQLQFPEDLPLSASVLISSPALLKRLAGRLASEQQPKLIFSSGGALDFAAAQHSHELLGSWPFEIYGSTETGGIALRQQRFPNSLWRTLPRVTVRQHVSNNRLELLSAYCGQQQWFATDDCIRVEQGGFHLLGRMDSVVKIEEKRISLTRVEQVIQSCLPHEAQLRVIPWHRGRRQVLAVIIALPRSQHHLVDQAQIKSVLAEYVEPLAIPKEWRLVEFLPTNSMGKVERQSLEYLLSVEVA